MAIRFKGAGRPVEYMGVSLTSSLQEALNSGRRIALLSVLAALTLTASVGVPTASARGAHPGASTSSACSDGQYPASRDPSNPLNLANTPGPNPLNGAHMFVDGPRHGPAAGAIATLLGLDPTKFADNYSWARFRNDFETGLWHFKLVLDPSLAQKVHEFEKIADRPEANRFSMYSAGGGPGAILSQVHKIFCGNLTADPGSVPIITTYFLYQAGYCETKHQILANRPTFKRQINEMVQGIGRRPAIMLLELDAIGSSQCMAKTGALRQWEGDIRYEVNKVTALPHTLVYIEGGYSDSSKPRYAAKVLNAVGVRKTRGFFTNDTHENWTIDEIRWGNSVSRLTHGSHFIVNTANNGQGPKRNPHPGRQGNSDLCNPPGRGLGPPPTTATNFPAADAFLWTAPPGNSSGPCRGGPPAGTFWPAKALREATLASAALGPGAPLPY